MRWTGLALFVWVACDRGRLARPKLTVGPGMAVTVEIKTGKRQVIEFLLAPLKRYQDESLKER